MGSPEDVLGALLTLKYQSPRNAILSQSTDLLNDIANDTSSLKIQSPQPNLKSCPCSAATLLKVREITTSTIQIKYDQSVKNDQSPAEIHSSFHTSVEHPLEHPPGHSSNRHHPYRLPLPASPFRYPRAPHSSLHSPYFHSPPPSLHHSRGMTHQIPSGHTLVCSTSAQLSSIKAVSKSDSEVQFKKVTQMDHQSSMKVNSHIAGVHAMSGMENSEDGHEKSKKSDEVDETSAVCSIASIQTLDSQYYMYHSSPTRAYPSYIHYSNPTQPPYFRLQTHPCSVYPHHYPLDAFHVEHTSRPSYHSKMNSHILPNTDEPDFPPTTKRKIIKNTTEMLQQETIATFTSTEETNNSYDETTFECVPISNITSNEIINSGSLLNTSYNEQQRSFSSLTMPANLAEKVCCNVHTTLNCEQKSLSHNKAESKKRRASSGKWTPEEDAKLCSAVSNNSGKNWKKISLHLPGRSDVQCLHRWQKVLKPGLVKGPWTPEEDALVIDLVKMHGQKKWSFIARQLDGRLGKQCRERWCNHLSPDIKKGGWTEEEDKLLIECHSRWGNKWAVISKSFNGRTDNAIKNRWNSTLKRRISKDALGKNDWDENPCQSEKKHLSNNFYIIKRSMKRNILHADNNDKDAVSQAAVALSGLASSTIGNEL